MAADAGYTLFDDLDEDDGDAEEEARTPEAAASEAEEEPGPPGKPDLSSIKVPIMDNLGHLGAAGGASNSSVFKDSGYQGPTISGIGAPGMSNWTPEKEFANGIERSQRLQAEMALDEAVKQKDPLRCAASLAKMEQLGLDTATPIAELAESIADQDYLMLLREARTNKALEDELREFAELMESGEAFALPGADEEGGEAFGEGEEFAEDPDGAWAAEEPDANSPEGQARSSAREDAPAAPASASSHQRQAREEARPPQRARRRRRKSPSLVEKLLFGANAHVPSSASASDEGKEEEGENEDWPLPSEQAADEAAGGDPDMQLVGIWQFGPQASDRIRISRPARGFLLVDRQLPTGQRASGELRRGGDGGVLEASLAIKEGRPAGHVRVRGLDARNVAVSLRPSEEAPWPPDEAAEKATLWVCCPPEKRPIGIREIPEFDGQRTGSVLRPGEVFCVSAEQPSPTGEVLWLRLADGRGWVFDRQPGAASLCVRCDLPISGFSVLDGFMHAGGEIHYEELSLEDAKVRCAALPDCQGFCYEGPAKPQGPVGVVFKNRWKHGGAGEETGWTSVRVERGAAPALAELEAGGLGQAAMTPAEEEDARAWYDSISQGWLTRLKPEGANEGGINALEDIIASMDRCDVAEDPELEVVRKGLERTKDVGCTALTPLTREDQALVPTGKLTSCFRPYSAKEGDDQMEPNDAVGKLTGRTWVNEFRRHHPAARVSPGLALRALTGEEAHEDAEEAEVLFGGASSSGGPPARQKKELVRPAVAADADDDEADDKGREVAWWDQQEVEVSEAVSLQERAAHIAPGVRRPKAKPKERSKMAMPKARLLTASLSSQPRARSGILSTAASSSGAGGELGTDLSGLWSWT